MKRTLYKAGIGILAGICAFCSMCNSTVDAGEKMYTYDEVQEMIAETIARQESLSQKVFQYELGDMNCDGNLDSDDVVIMLNMINERMLENE